MPHNAKLYLAPMEDVTDPAFRLLCKRFGASRVYTEFVNADALVRDVTSTTRKLQMTKNDLLPYKYTDVSLIVWRMQHA